MVPPQARGDGIVVVELRGPLIPAEVRQICDRVRALLPAAGERRIVCTVHGPADLGVIDALARLQLHARRVDAALRIRSDGADLEALLVFAGLPGLIDALEPIGQAEAGEQSGVEEVVDVRDLPG